MVDIITGRNSASDPAQCLVRTPEALGQLARAHRRGQRITLQDVYESTGLTTRFLSRFERGKPNASIARVMEVLHAVGLEVLVLSHRDAVHVVSALSREQALAARD